MPYVMIFYVKKTKTTKLGANLMQNPLCPKPEDSRVKRKRWARAPPGLPPCNGGIHLQVSNVF